MTGREPDVATGATHTHGTYASERTRIMTTQFRLVVVGCLLLATACGGSKDAPPAMEQPVGPPPAAAAPTAAGKVITVEMITDETGSYFKPKEFEAHPGDIIRFTLTIGVHNAHFVADSNSGVTGLPPATELLQLPGQTVDVVVPAAPGKRLFFQCDPHAALGMIGYVKVEGDDDE